MFHYWLPVLCLCLFSCLLFAATGDEHTFELKWQEEGFFDSMEASLDRSEPFSKEPDFGSRDVLRGELSFGTSGHESQMGFAWDKLEGKLYVDLNRDEDLTNDPNGVLESNDTRAGQYYNQNFPVFPLSFSTDLGVYHYRLRSFMQSYSGDYKRAEFRVNSGYSGKTELNGRQWRIKVNDKLMGMIQRGNKFSISPSDNPASNAMSSLPLPENIFIDGRCYEIGFEFKKSENPSPSLWCTLRGKIISTDKLQIESKWISRLVFGNSEILILLEPVEGIAIIPTGNYTVKQCNLKYDKEKPVISPARLNEIKVTVSDNSENILRIGGPLKSQVSIQRTGKVLKFDYELVGAGGEKYDAQQIAQYNNEKKPSVAIYKGDMQLATGEFEYG
jgi:hypothetical protein